jgi:hypothetical protein
MIFDFLKLSRRMNKADKKVGKAVNKAMEAVTELSEANNALEALSGECEAKANHYSTVNETAKEKMFANEKMIDQLKNINKK